jgi:hypothetical protein
VRSGIVADVTAVSAKVVGPGRLSFWWRVTAASDWPEYADFDFALIVGGERAAAVSEQSFPESDPERWEPVVVDLPSGEQLVTWRLESLGGCTDPAEGTAWLDQVAFTGWRPTITRFVPRLGGGCRLECQAPPGTRLALQHSTDLVSWQNTPVPSELVPSSGSAEIELPEAVGRHAFFRLEVLGE